MKTLLIIATIFGVVTWLGCVFALQIVGALFATFFIGYLLGFSWFMYFDLKS